jgi:hypothetical protein
MKKVREMMSENKNLIVFFKEKNIVVTNIIIKIYSYYSIVLNAVFEF